MKYWNHLQDVGESLQIEWTVQKVGIAVELQEDAKNVTQNATKRQQLITFFKSPRVMEMVYQIRFSVYNLIFYSIYFNENTKN